MIIVVFYNFFLRLFTIRIDDSWYNVIIVDYLAIISGNNWMGRGIMNCF